MTWSWGQMILALRFRGFRLFWAGKATSYVAGGAYTVAITYIVWRLTGQPLAVGAVLAVQFLPTIAFGPLFGGLVDRWDRRRAMITQQALGAVVSATMSVLVLTGYAQVWNIYTLLFLSGSLTAFSNPLQAAFITEVVPKEDPSGRGQPRKSGGSLNSLAWQSGNLVGAALAGTLIPVWGVGVVMASAPLAAMAPIVLLCCIRPQDRTPPTPSARKKRGGAWEGITHVSADPDLMVALLLGAAVSMIAMGTIQVGVQLLVLAEYATTPTQEAQVLGWVGVALAVGGIGSQLLAGGGGYTPSGRVLTRIVLVLSAVLIGIALAPNLWWVLAGVGAASLLAYSHQTICQLVNLAAPTELQGRIAGLWFALGSGGKAVAGVVVGGLAELLGPQGGMLVCAVLLLSVALVVAAIYRRHTSTGPLLPSPTAEDP